MATVAEASPHGAVLRVRQRLAADLSNPVWFEFKQIAVPIDYGISVGEPAALGGLLVAVLILSPESLAAVRAAMANELQRSINLSLGTALSTISLTISVLTIGFITDKTIILGFDAAATVLLLLTLVVSMLTWAGHLLLFIAYLMLIFEK